MTKLNHSATVSEFIMSNSNFSEERNNNENYEAMVDSPGDQDDEQLKMKLQGLDQTSTITKIDKEDENSADEDEEEDITVTNLYDIDLYPEDTFWQTMVSCRWVVAYMAFFCYFILYALRTNLSMAMICMVKPPVNGSSTKLHPDADVNGTNTQASGHESQGEIDWDNKTQGWILSSMFYGFAVTPFLGGFLAGKVGGKKVVLVSMMVVGVATLLIPVAARFDGTNHDTAAALVILLRVICGLGSGCVIPAMFHLWKNWAPKYERSKLLTFCITGATAGNIVMTASGGFLCKWTAFDGGWPSIFYLCGSVCLLFCLIWLLVVHDTPRRHPRISRKEKTYILTYTDTHTGSIRVVPWKSMLKSGASWAIIIAKTCADYGMFTLHTKLPAFMRDVLKFDIVSNGLYSTLPYVAMFIVANVSSHVVDLLRSKKILTTTMARKLCAVLGLAVPAAILFGLGHVPAHLNYIAVILLTIGLGLTGFYQSVFFVNPQDIAPKYAGELAGIVQKISSLSGLCAPLIASLMTPNGSPEEWQMVFYIWAAIFMFGTIFYLIFGKGETQSWALGDNDGNSRVVGVILKQIHVPVE